MQALNLSCVFSQAYKMVPQNITAWQTHIVADEIGTVVRARCLALRGQSRACCSVSFRRLLLSPTSSASISLAFLLFLNQVQTAVAASL